MMRIFGKLFLTAWLILPAVVSAQTEATTETLTQSGDEAAPVESDPLHPIVKIETTLGDIVLKLNGEKAPITTLNFVRYVNEGFYEGLIFHRVMKNFMIQGGGFTPDMEERNPTHPPIENEWQNGLKNEKGTIAMARLGRRPNSATSQFFINVVDNPSLDQPRDGAAYAVFGKVIEGMETVEKIRNAEVVTHPKYPSPSPVVPKEPIVIESAKVVSDFNPAVLEKKIKEMEEAERQAREAAEAAKLREIEEAIARIEKETGKKFQETESGLKYLIVEEGEGASPKPSDTVRVHYEGTLPDGTKFDSSYDRGQPTEFRLNRVIEGWIEGLGMMKTGGVRYLVIPADLGYGDRDMGDIPPNSTLIFKVELLEVK